MEVQRLVIFYNHYDFPNDGVAAKSFGGNVELKSELGDMNLRLKPHVVQAVLELVAAEVEAVANTVGRSVSATAIKKQAQGLVLDHQREIFPNG